MPEIWQKNVVKHIFWTHQIFSLIWVRRSSVHYFCGGFEEQFKFFQITRLERSWNLEEKRNVAHIWDSSNLKFELSASFINSLLLWRLQQKIWNLAKYRIIECLKSLRKTQCSTFLNPIKFYVWCGASLITLLMLLQLKETMTKVTNVWNNSKS